MNKKAAEQQRAVRSMETPEQYSEFEDSVIEAAKTQAQRIIDDARRQGDANFDKLMEGHRRAALRHARARHHGKYF